MPLTPNFNPFPVLETERLLLRQVGYEDAKAVLAMRSSKTVMRYIDRPLAQTEDDARELIGRIVTGVEENNGINWAICLKGDNSLKGLVSFWRMDKENYRAETGYMLQEDMQGKGLMREALQAILHYGFRVMGVHSVEANINPANEASIKLAERMGFKREAYFRENYYYDGKFLDSVIYSLLESDYTPGI